MKEEHKKNNNSDNNPKKNESAPVKKEQNSNNLVNAIRSKIGMNKNNKSNKEQKNIKEKKVEKVENENNIDIKNNKESKNNKEINKNNLKKEESKENKDNIKDINNANLKKEEEIKKDKDINENNNINNNITTEIKKEENKPGMKPEDTNNLKKKEKSPAKILSSVVTTGKEKVNDIYLKKVKDLSNTYHFTSDYLSFISQVFKKLCEPFYSKLSSSYINNVKPYLKYFKELVTILVSFSDKLNNLNSSIEDKNEDNDEENLIRVENNLNSAIKKLNMVFADTSSVVAKNLKENILNKPLFAKFEVIEGKFEENFHKMLNLMSVFEQFRIKYDNEYIKKYSNIFEEFIQKYNEPDNYLIKMKDFFLIEYDIVKNANHSMKKVTKFIDDIKKLFEDSTNIFCDYLEMLKIMIKIYYEENKKIILPNVLTEKMINDLEKLLSQDIRKNIEKKFCIKNIIEHYQDEALRNEINHLLLKYQETLDQYKIIENEEIKNISHFNLKYFKSTEIFFNFLLSLIPAKFQVNYDDVIQFKTDVKRDNGIFKGWKECHMIISYQGHILFFDEEKLEQERKMSGNDISSTVANKKIENINININDYKEENNRKSLGMSEIVTNKLADKNDNAIVQLKQSKSLDEKEEVKYGIIPDKLSLMYLKTSYGIKKKDNKQGKYLFEIWEKGIGNKRSKINVIDALDQKNLENIILELTETNIYDV